MGRDAEVNDTPDIQAQIEAVANEAQRIMQGSQVEVLLSFFQSRIPAKLLKEGCDDVVYAGYAVKVVATRMGKVQTLCYASNFAAPGEALNAVLLDLQRQTATPGEAFLL